MLLLAKYATSFPVPFALHTLDGTSLQKSAVHAAGDSIVSKNEGADANTTNGFVDNGSGYSLTLTATEMTAARILLMIEDQSAPKVWLSKSFEIFTYGNASAHLPFDLSQIVPLVDVNKINGSATAAASQALAALGIVSGTFATGTLSTVEATTNLTGAAEDYYKGTLIPISGTLVGQRARIRRYLVTGGKLLFTPFTAAPANGDLFIIV